MYMLFVDGDLAEYLHRHNIALHDEVQKASNDEILQADAKAWAAALAEAYSVRAPELKGDERWAEEPEPTPFDARLESQTRLVLDSSRPVPIPGTRVRIHIPFDGDPDIFRLTASTRGYNPPFAEVAEDELIFDLHWPNDRPADPGAHVSTALAKVEEYLQWSRSDCEVHNRGLAGYALGQIERRVGEIRAARASLDTSGIPVRSANGKPRISDAIVRRPTPRGERPAAGQRLIALEPQLSDDVYEHILQVVRRQGDAMQRAPQPYLDMREEDLRHVLLSTLNTHYAGKVAAEAFNGSGKTDILVRDGERAVFIAECKRWNGAKALAQALDQLLGYSTWHDTKLALVIFVDRADLQDVHTKAATSLAEHKAVQTLNPNSSGELHATLRFGDEEGRRADLTTIFIHLPK
jgi:hypothetical protein